MTYTCKRCNKKFNGKPSQKRKYCSRFCAIRSRVGKKRPEHSRLMTGPSNPKWKEKSDGSMESLHIFWRRRIPKPEFCQHCEEVPPLDLANVSGKYKQEASDWEWLCRQCHIHSDGRLNNLNKGIVEGVGRDPLTGKFINAKEL